MLYTKDLAEKFKESLWQFDFKGLEWWNTFKVIASDETIDRDWEI